MRYTSADVGCHAWSKHGADHIRETLAMHVKQISCTGPKPDDLPDEEEALAILQSHTAPGLTWKFVDGDLMLTGESDG